MNRGLFLKLKFSVDERQVATYIGPIISPVASVAGREAGSSESASAFSGGAA